MSVSFKQYRQSAFRAIRELLCCKNRTTVMYYITKAKSTTTETELSRVLAEVREII